MSVPGVDHQLSQPASWQRRPRPVMQVVAADHVARNNTDTRSARSDAVNVTSQVAPRRMLVRPDRPTSSGVRTLQAVPTAPSPADIPAGVSWKLASVPRVSSSRISYQPVRQEASAEQELVKHVRDGFAMLGQAVHSLRMWSLARFAVGLTIAVVAAVGVVSFFGFGPQAGSVYMVQPGDTVTSIAATVEAPGDTADVINDIYALNVLEGNVLQPGQEVILPRY